MYFHPPQPPGSCEPAPYVRTCRRIAPKPGNRRSHGIFAPVCPGMDAYTAHSPPQMPGNGHENLLQCHLALIRNRPDHLAIPVK